MISSVSSIICKMDKMIVFVIEDELSLFTNGNLSNLNTLFENDSKTKLDLLFDKAEANHSALNWELNIKQPQPNTTIFCSMVTWKSLVFIRLSEKPIPSFYFDLIIDNEKPASLFLPKETNRTNENRSGRYVNLQLQMSDLQKELQRKNIQIEALNEKLEVLSNVDSLSCLYNRKAIVDRLGIELVRAMREKKLLGFGVIDIDQMQLINTKYGHPVGDKCIKETANILKGSIRQYDAVGRLGGDEFLVVFSTFSVSQFNSILERLHYKINSVEIPVDGDDPIDVKVSIGGIWASTVHPNTRVEALLNQAEKNLIRAKSSGGNKIISGEFEQIP